MSWRHLTLARIPLAFVALLAAVWTISALLLAGGANPILAVLLALVLTAAAPACVAAYRHRRQWLRGWASVALVWNTTALAILVLATPDLLALVLREHGWVLSAHAVGEDHRATRAASMLSHEVADAIAPRDQPPVQFPAETHAILVDVELVGPDGAVELPYLWDTGASYTTITRATAEQLGLTIVDDAPEVELETAAGTRRSILAYLPAIRVAGHEVKGLAVSICDDCAHKRSRGLLGLNAMRHFVSELHGPEGQLALRPVSVEDRTSDIAPFVDLSVVGEPSVISGHVHWRLEVHNRSPRTLHAVRPRVSFGDGTVLLGEPIDALPPGATERARVVGSIEGDAGLDFTLALHDARW